MNHFLYVSAAPWLPCSWSWLWIEEPLLCQCCFLDKFLCFSGWGRSRCKEQQVKHTGLVQKKLLLLLCVSAGSCGIPPLPGAGRCFLSAMWCWPAPAPVPTQERVAKPLLPRPGLSLQGFLDNSCFQHCLSLLEILLLLCSQACGFAPYLFVF